MTPDEIEALTEGLPSKSAKIRRLSAAGLPPAEIARALGIRYQFAYNVINSLGGPASASDDRAETNAAEPTLEDLIRLAHRNGFAVTFHPLREGGR